MAQLENILELPLEDVIGDRFGRYSKYIIQDRALPDARDGLKPVQRRILYAMYNEGNTADKPFRKSAKTVGNVIGNYHPHGDTSVYDAMVRMSQDWKVRNVLIEMHGNNGSVDGDPPAAMRYTEARLSAISSILLRDIDKKTVEFIPNFDDSDEEPTVLPANFPNLLANGSTGISAGYATEIPPHQLGETIDAAIMRLERPTCTVDDIMTVMPGPDFPTGGTIQGIDGIKKAYETGRGKIVIRAKSELETVKGGKQQIVITEIPYEVNKATLVKKMDELRLDKKLEGIAEVRDESDRTGLRIVIELRKEVEADHILNYLYKNTDLQVPYNFNMVAIFNRRPKLMSVLELLDAYIAHQKEVVTKRTAFDLAKAKARNHIVEGLMKALSILDEVIATIRGAQDKRDAKNQLIERFRFTEEQAEAIVTLQLYRLTNTDITALQQEADELGRKIAEYEAILASEKRLIAVMKNELKAVRKQFNDTRRSVIEAEIEEIKINVELTIPDEDVFVTVTKDGYIKRTSQRSYNASNGQEFGIKEGDRLLLKQFVNTKETLLIFTNKGNYLYVPVHEVPDIRWKDIGQHVASIAQLGRDETILQSFIVPNFTDEKYVVTVTKNGMIKKTELAAYQASRYNKAFVGINLRDDDEVVNVFMTDGTQRIMIATYLAMSLVFMEQEVSVTGMRTSGVKSIGLKDDDYVVGSTLMTEKEHCIIVSQRGSAKRVKMDGFNIGSRAQRGNVIFRELKKDPHRVAFVGSTADGTHLRVRQNQTWTTVPFTDFNVGDTYSGGTYIVDGPIHEVYIERNED